MDAKTQFLSKLTALDELPLTRGAYAITGSGPLAIRNWRSANDVDILVTTSLYKELLKMYSPVDEKHILVGNVEIWGKFVNLTPRMDEVIAKSEWLEGYPFITLEETLNWKQFLNRDKDQKDIALLETYLSPIKMN